jgi:hypothetical protein
MVKQSTNSKLQTLAKRTVDVKQTTAHRNSRLLNSAVSHSYVEWAQKQIIIINYDESTIWDIGQLGMREESLKLYVWGMKPLPYIQLTFLLHFAVRWLIYFAAAVQLYLVQYLLGRGRIFFPLYVVQTGSGARTTS